MDEFVTVGQMTNQADVTRTYIHYLIKIKETPFPGAKKVYDSPTSPYLIPKKEFENWMKSRKPRAKKSKPGK